MDSCRKEVFACAKVMVIIMKSKDKEVFFELCSFRTENQRSLYRHLTQDIDLDLILGRLYMNRMAGIAYGVLEKNDLLKMVSREFRNALYTAYQYNTLRNISYYKCIDMLTECLAECDKKYAFLKGAYLCGKYPTGYRISNDVDILVSSENVTLIGRALRKAGFEQGYIRNNVFVPASRREIISSKMLRGETVPYVMEVDLPCMKYFEVDINFSLDHKNGNEELVCRLISDAEKIYVNGIALPVLKKEDFIIHLCEHLYKEAATYPWIKTGRDMTLYKYCDIYYMLDDISKEEAEELYQRIKDLGCEKACYYAMFSTGELFLISDIVKNILLDRLGTADTEFVNIVEDLQDKKRYRYLEDDISKRFWCNNRMTILEEI